jgi:UDP-N-acetylglucosamine--N-acetylmuramyl-(pentapeptide) pyrophosphoryl-undecaprenol N-acetylglucosamine transferase
VVVHEANARAGLANRIGARFAAAVATSYPDTPLRNAVRTGIPLRSSIATLDRAAQRAEALTSFGLQELPTLLVFGGSQGARRINESVAAAAAALTGAGVQVLHATGAAHADSVRAALAEQGVAGGGSHAPYVVVPYLDRMDLAYSAADLALCRAGAMTCAELAAVGLPAVFVPLPHGNGEQALNAAEVVAAGGALRVDDADLTADWVRANVASLAADRSRLAGMAQKAAGFGRRDAADALAAIVERIAAQR